MATVSAQFWANMKDKAATKLSELSDWPRPDSEHSVKCTLAHVMRHGTYEEAADAIVEAVEWQVSCMMERMHEHMPVPAPASRPV